jgi:CheY-like chemotaxis protein
MSEETTEEATPSSILIVDGEIISRHVIGVYLRHCGYAVVEAASADEAYVALKEPTLSIDVILCAVSSLQPKAGFELSQWVRTNRPELEVKLVGGVEMAAQAAS